MNDYFSKRFYLMHQDIYVILKRIELFFLVKLDNKGIELMKQFIKDIYYLYVELERKKGELTNKLFFIDDTNISEYICSFFSS